jgi:hypothetical protein
MKLVKANPFIGKMKSAVRSWFDPCRKKVPLAGLILLATGGAGAADFGSAATNSLADISLEVAEYQVKALFLLNFTKYVDWPPAAFAGTNAPIVIGLYGEDKFGDALTNAVAGQTVSGRQIVIQPIEKDGDFGKCQMLFISDSEKNHLGEILDKIKALPVLTVGETDQFMEWGGMINFVKKEGKIRLEINLAAARQAKLGISSKLLDVADMVKGKAN